MSHVIIGMDPHKRSATIEVMTSDETVVGAGRYGTDAAGHGAMLAEAKRWPQRTWAIEGCQGIGRHIANRLLADGEDVAASDCDHLYPQPGTDELAGEAARLAWGEVPGLDQPMDCVGKGLTQEAGLKLQLVAGLGVIATGIAVDDPDALGAPGQSCPQSALH
jgi:hypothetical protein